MEDNLVRKRLDNCRAKAKNTANFRSFAFPPGQALVDRIYDSNPAAVSSRETSRSTMQAPACADCLARRGFGIRRVQRVWRDLRVQRIQRHADRRHEVQ